MSLQLLQVLTHFELALLDILASNFDSSTIGKVSCKLFPFTLLNYSFFIFGRKTHKEELHTYPTLHVA